MGENLMKPFNPLDSIRSRRDFLGDVGKLAIAAGTGATAVGKGHNVTAASQPSSDSQSDKKIRIGVVGGGFGSAFYWHLHPQCVVGAVSDLRPERLKHLQDTYKCNTPYPSLTELLKDK